MTIVSRLRALMAVMILAMTGFHGLPALAEPDTHGYLVFDGNDDAVTSPAFALPGQVTFEAWINPASLSNTKSQDRVISKGVIELMVSTGDTGCAAGAGHVQWRATIGGVDRRLCGGALSLNSWQHIAGTYDGAQFRLYVNGVEVASMARSGTLATNDANLVVGNAAASSRPFHGAIDEVRIWGRALSVAELQANMNVELSEAQAGLLAYYRFNEGDGQTVGDGSGNGRDAVLGSDATVQVTDPSWVQTGLASTTVPDVVGQPQATASSMIAGAGLALGTVNETPSNTVPPGSVISQSPSGGSRVSTGSTVNLVVSRGPSTGGGIPGEAYLIFDGTDDRVHAGSFAQGSRITFEAWIKPVSLSNTKLQDRVISKGVFELMVSTRNTGCTAGAGHVQWRARIGGVDRRLCGGALALNSWQHIAGTYDGAQFVLYVNGVQVASMALSGTLATNNAILVIGNAAASSRPFHGAIDEVRIWGRALSAAELQSNMNVELSGTQVGLLAYYRFNEGDGQTAGDDSGNGRYAVLGSDATVQATDPVWVGGGSILEPGLPTIDVSSPGVGSWVSRKVKIAAAVADESGVAEITLAIDGTVIHSPTTNPFRYEWDTTGYSNGPHQISVMARAGDGDVKTVSRQVIVDNYAGALTIPYPYSTEIVGIDLAARSSMVSTAEGNDNWPITWADDGELYTAYGDGWGFRNEVTKKLSLGFAKVTGSPPGIDGINIRSSSGEQIAGSGDAGRKGSGMLMVDGVLYMWVRNANLAGQQCQLAWSTDHAVTWTWSAWRFEEFGYCTFLNFGRNYGGARDDFVYMYSPDSPSGTIETDRVVLTRVPRGQILEESAYEFFAGLDAAGDPVWSPLIGDRRSVYEFPGGANRLDVVYNPGLGRYLMTMRARDWTVAGNPRHFSIYDAPEPWGPWTTIYFTDTFYGEPLPAGSIHHGGWDEAQRLPSKWIEAEGSVLQLLCSCSDTFSVVRVQLTTP